MDNRFVYSLLVVHSQDTFEHNYLIGPWCIGCLVVDKVVGKRKGAKGKLGILSDGVAELVEVLVSKDCLHCRYSHSRGTDKQLRIQDKLGFWWCILPRSIIL